MADSDIPQVKAIAFDRDIERLTEGFTGREWVFAEIDRWLHQGNERFFLLTGEPGVGKSAIADRLTQLSLSTESSHPHLPPGFLSAIHCCSARDSTSVDPKNFARAIALQLAQKIPQFAQALKDIGEKQVTIRVEQSIEKANNSTIQGVVIQNLDLSGMMTAQEAFNWVFLNPLHAICQAGFDQPITILVDALDEALTHEGSCTIVALLSKLENLPPQIRFILTSRKEAQVENKLHDTEELNLSAPKFNDLNQADIYAYIQTYFTQAATLATLLPDLEPHQREASIAQIAKKSEGNFLYVRFLLDEIARGERSLTDLEGLPEGLDGLYYQSLARVIELGKQDWRTTYAPVIGVLSVARTSLTLSQLQAFTRHAESTLWQCLGDLRQFLEELEPQGMQEVEVSYRLYHQSIVDFLRQQSLILGNNARHNPYYLPAKESHQRIGDRYWQTSQSIESIDWNRLDSYAYDHLAYHMMGCDRKDELCALLTNSPKWMETKFIYCNGDTSYASDLELAINSFSDPLTVPQLLVLIQLYTVRQVLYQRVERYDDIDLRTLVWLGRETEALNHARLRSSNQERFISLYILNELFAQRNQPRPSLLKELQETAYSIEEPRSRVSTLGMIARLLARSGHKVEAEAIFAEAEQLTVRIDNQSQKALVLRELVLNRARAGYLLEAEEIARAIDDPTWQAWSLAVVGESLAKANQIEKAKVVFLESQEQALTLLDGYKQSWLLKELAVLIINAMDLDTAETIALAISDPQKRAEALSELGAALVKAGLDTKAKAVFVEAETLARTIDLDLRQGEALKDLTRSLAASKYYAEAERVARTIEHDWLKAEALRMLSVELAQAERFSEAERVSVAIQDNGERAFALRVLAMVLAKTGNPTAATKFFQEAGAIAPVIEDKVISVFALAALAMTLNQADYKTQADKIFQETLAAAKSIQEDITHTSTLKTLGSELAQYRYFSESERFARAIEEPLKRAWTLKALAISLAQNGCQAKAFRIFADIEALAEIVEDNKDRGIVPNHKDWVLEELSRALTQVGYFAEAERVAWSILEDKWKATCAFLELAKALAQNKMFLEARRIVQAIPKTDWKQVEALCAIAVATHSEDEATATSLLSEARQIAESIEDPTWKPWALKALVTALAQIKQFAEAEAIARAIADTEKRAWAWKDIAIASGQPENFVQAGKAVEEIANGTMRAGEFQDLAETLVQLGRETDANELFMAAENAVQTEEARYRASALKDLAIRNARLGRFIESRKIIGAIDSWMDRDKASIALAGELIQSGCLEDAKKLIQTIEEDKERQRALGALSIALMRQQRFAEALQELGPQTPDSFVHILASCASGFSPVRDKLPIEILRHVVRICGWARPDWRKIDQVLSAPVVLKNFDDNVLVNLTNIEITGKDDD
jgi:hypothetical protein